MKHDPSPHRLAFAVGLLLAAMFFSPFESSVAMAGGGPENVCLVVNSRSWASKTIANHYIRLRNIPSANVVNIDWPHDVQGVEVPVLRAKILGPVLQAIHARKLSAQIDAIVYSADFPYSVNLQADAAGIPSHQILTTTASLTGATYFYGNVMAASPLLIGIENNRYFRRLGDKRVASQGFCGWYGWGPSGELQESGGEQYLLSAMLGYTSGRGNSVREVVRTLERSAAADGTHPKGTIYYVKNDDIRSKVRHDGFPAAIEELKSRKVAAEEVAGIVPAGKKDVLGAMIGKSVFDWKSSNSTILPGAFCDNFTSFGGVLQEVAGQTPLTEFIRYGAAGSSGTVTEPYAVKEKFSSPWLHVHYARGCTLAESFYQSVHGPYQQLLVGDPLCRPWANIASVSLAGVEEGATVKGTLSIRPTAKGVKVDRWHLFLDGLRMQQIADGESFALNSGDYPDGFHEIRVVGIEASPIESQGRKIVAVTFNNRDQSLSLTASAEKATWGTPLKISAQGGQAAAITIFHNRHPLGKIRGKEGTITVEPRELGEGPVELRALAAADDEIDQVASKPLRIEVVPGPALPAQKFGMVKLADGMRLRIKKDPPSLVQDMLPTDWATKAGIEAKTPFEIGGVFSVTSDEVYQFQVKHNGRVRIVVDSKELYNDLDSVVQWRYLPVPLAAGKHLVTISGELGSPPQLQMHFGGPGATSLNGKSFQHTP